MSMNAQKILDERDVVIQLVTAVNTDHVPFYAYVLIKADRWKAIEKRMMDETIDISREGKILAYGQGHEPDPAHKAAIADIIQQIRSS